MERGREKHVQVKGAILKEEILNEGAVIGGTQFKTSHRGKGKQWTQASGMRGS